MHSENKLRAAVNTRDKFLFQKIKLDIMEIAEASLITDSEEGDFDIYFFDLDTAVGKPRGITMSRMQNTDCPLPLPFLIGEAKRLVSGISVRGLRLITEDRCAVLHGRSVKLTEVEYNLLYSIYSRRGEYVSRAEILREVWGESADSGIINVYVHYLREKLEADGEKIIISSRNMGYQIDSKYITEGEVC